MPTATVELMVEKAYLVVGFRPVRPKPDVPANCFPVDRTTPLPAGLAAFGREGETLAYADLVTVILEKGERGAVDLTPMLVAADWLREQGWDVEPLGWCRLAMENAKAV